MSPVCAGVFMPELTCLTGTVHLLQILLRDLCKALQPQQSNSRQGSKLKAFHHPHMQQGGTLCFVKNFACHTTAISPSGEPEAAAGQVIVSCSSAQSPAHQAPVVITCSPCSAALSFAGSTLIPATESCLTYWTRGAQSASGVDAPCRKLKCCLKLMQAPADCRAGQRQRLL